MIITVDSLNLNKKTSQATDDGTKGVKTAVRLK